MEKEIIKIQSEFIEMQKELIKLLKEKIAELEKRSEKEYVPVPNPWQPTTPIQPWNPYPWTTGDPIPNWDNITTTGAQISSVDTDEAGHIKITGGNANRQEEVSDLLKKFAEQ